jgi:hypothetical protein
MTRNKLSFLLALILTLGLLHTQASPITYTFVPDANDFNSDDFGGSITLDISSSNNGQTIDVLGVNIYGPYINPEHFDSATEFLTLFGAFTWNASTITSMSLNVNTGTLDNGSFVFGVYDNGIYEAGMDAQANGSWVNLNSSVPDGAETGLLLGSALALLALARHRSPLWRAVVRR